MIEKPLPNSVTIENSLIASMLINTELINPAIEQVAAEHFYNTLNQKIYSEIIAQYDDGRTPDIVSISEAFKLDTSVCLHLSEILENQSTTTDIKNYIKIINEKAIRRRIVENTELIQKQAMNEESAPSAMLDQIEHLNNIVEDYSTGAGIKKRRRGRLITIGEMKQEIENFWEAGKEKLGFAFPSWPILSNHYRLVRGTINVINGIPTHGKTSFIDAMVIESILGDGWKWAIFSPENKPYYLHVQPLGEKYTGKPFFGDNAMSRSEIELMIEKLNNHIIFLEPDENNRTRIAIKNLITEALKNGKIDGIMIDPWNKIEMDLKMNESETQYIARSLLDLQYLARNHNIYIGIAAHPAKMYRAPKQTKYPVPTLYDLSGGANWYNGVDNGITVYRNFEKNYIEVHVQKVKFLNHGKVGTGYFRYNSFNTRFNEIKKSDLKNDDDSECFIIPEDVKPGKIQTEFWQDKL